MVSQGDVSRALTTLSNKPERHGSSESTKECGTEGKEQRERDGLCGENSLNLFFYCLGFREKKGDQPCPLGNVAPWVLQTLINQISNSLSKRRNKKKLLKYPLGHIARPWGGTVGGPSHTHQCRAALYPEEDRSLSRKSLPLQAQTLLWRFTGRTWSFSLSVGGSEQFLRTVLWKPCSQTG